MPQKVMTGARAKFCIVDPSTGNVRTLGVFSNVSYGVTVDVQPAYILGRFSPAELDYTGQEPVGVTASGWRVIDHGPYQDAGMPQLQNLMTSEYITLIIIDRQTDARIATIHSCRCTGFSTAINARQQSEITVNFVGLLADDEFSSNAEAAGAADLPS